MGALKIAQIEYSYVHEEIIRTGYKEARALRPYDRIHQAKQYRSR